MKYERNILCRKRMFLFMLFIIIFLFVVTIVSINHLTIMNMELLVKKRELLNMNNELEDILKQQGEENNNKEVYREVLFTSYYIGDGSSGTTTASGFTVDDFKVNEQGFYTYKDLVVIATSNTTRMDKELFSGYKTHELGDTISIVINEQEYQAIVLDVCGACYGVQGESFQRYDIFTNGVNIGVTHGYIKERLKVEGHMEKRAKK